MSNEVNEGFVDRIKDIARGLGGGVNQQQTPTTTQPTSPTQNQPSNQSAATTASKQAKGTSAAKGGGRVQPKAGMIDVRRATYGKMMLALQAAGITDQNQQKQYAEQVITNIIIPFLTVHLNARGLNITDLRSKKSSLANNPIKDQSGNPRVITLSEQQVVQPQTQQPTTFIPSTPEAQSIAKTKIDINQPIPLFSGNASLLQRINSSIKSRAKNINVNDPNIQNQFKQIIKDLVDQLKINGITNKQIQENFDFTEQLLNEQITNRWKLLANIK